MLNTNTVDTLCIVKTALGALTQNAQMKQVIVQLGPDRIIRQCTTKLDII